MSEDFLEWNFTSCCCVSGEPLPWEYRRSCEHRFSLFFYAIFSVFLSLVELPAVKLTLLETWAVRRDAARFSCRDKSTEVIYFGQDDFLNISLAETLEKNIFSSFEKRKKEKMSQLERVHRLLIILRDLRSIFLEKTHQAFPRRLFPYHYNSVGQFAISQNRSINISMSPTNIGRRDFFRFFGIKIEWVLDF